MDFSTLYDNPTSPKPTPEKPAPRTASHQSRSRTGSWSEMSDAERAAALYDRPVEAGRSVAWRTAVADALQKGLITEEQSAAQEVKVIGDLKAAGLGDDIVDAIVAVAVGKPPIDAETREKWQRESLEKLQAEYGPRRMKLLQKVDEFVARHPPVTKLLTSTGALYEPRVVQKLAEHVRRHESDRQLRAHLAAKAAKES